MRLGFIALALFSFVHCTDDRSHVTLNEVKKADANPAVVQDWQGTSVTPPKTSGAQKAYVDPESGELAGPPTHDAPGSAQPGEASTLSNSADAMEEKPSPVPGGGVMIDMKNRFRSPISATIEHDGKLKIEHTVNDQSK